MYGAKCLVSYSHSSIEISSNETGSGTELSTLINITLHELNIARTCVLLIP